MYELTVNIHILYCADVQYRNMDVAASITLFISICFTEMQYTFETNIRDAYENIGLPDEVIQENDLTIKASSWQEALVKRMKEPYGPVFMAKVRSVSRD